MSLTGVIVGTFLQMMLAYFLFMLAVFAGGGVANGGPLGKFGFDGTGSFNVYPAGAECTKFRDSYLLLFCWWWR
jgi:hypothetical protein